MADYEKQIMIENYPRPTTIEGMKAITNQMEKCICKIYKKDGKKGTGCFCRISYKNINIPVLMTNNNVIDENYIKSNEKIKITLNDDKEDRTIQLNNNRTYYSNEKYDITIIEIKQEIDKIDNFMELDEKLFLEDSNNYFYNKQSIYIIKYPHDNDKAVVSFGIINQILDFSINYFSFIESGSFGAPIINLLNHKIIGIHTNGSSKINIGTFLKYPIIEFINNLNKINIKNIFIYNINEKNNIIERMLIKSFNYNINKDISNESNNKKEISGSPELIYNSMDQKIKKIKDLNPISKEEKYYPKGFKKCTFNCKINSLFQCLYYIPEFRNFFLEQNFDDSMTICEGIKDIMIGLNQLDGKNFFIQKKLIDKLQLEKIENTIDLLSSIFEKIIIELPEEEESYYSINQNEPRIDDRDLMFQKKYEEINFDIDIL